MRVGQKVILRESKERGRVIAVNDSAVHVKLSSGVIVKVLKDALIVVGLIRTLWDEVRGLVNSVIDNFKKTKD